MSGYVKLKTVSLKKHPQYNEAWLQQVIADDPTILGLGSVIVKDRERSHIGGGRLDMLLQDEEGSSRFEVEIQLGSSDESHIIRTIEYWDRERKMYPAYDHTAVLIAEDVTSRFLNVIGLFNGHIPIMALQVSAVETPDGVGLIFTRVVDTVRLGLDEDEGVSEVTDRAFWDKKASPASMGIADEVISLCLQLDPALQQTFKKNYIGFRLGNQPFNFALCKPKSQGTILEISLEKSESVDQQLSETTLDVLAYNRHFGKYRISLKPKDVKANQECLVSLLKQAFEERR